MKNKCLVCGKDVEQPRRLACSNECYEELMAIKKKEYALLKIMQANQLLHELTGFTSKDARIARGKIEKDKLDNVRQYKKLNKIN